MRTILFILSTPIRKWPPLDAVKDGGRMRRASLDTCTLRRLNINPTSNYNIQNTTSILLSLPHLSLAHTIHCGFCCSLSQIQSSTTGSSLGLRTEHTRQTKQHDKIGHDNTGRVLLVIRIVAKATSPPVCPGAAVAWTYCCDRTIWRGRAAQRRRRASGSV